jgi:pimeloyl-ACP methyl ester carboxylesterase
MRGSAALLVAVLLIGGCGSGDEGVKVPATRGSEQVSIPGPSEDMDGTLFGEGDIGVVLAHQNGLDQSSWFPFASKLVDEGYAVLTFDFLDKDLDGELGAAVGFLRSQAVDKVFVIGASKGGAAALALAAGDPDIAGVVSLSGVVSFGDVTLNQATVAKIEAPKLFIVDTSDSASLDADELFGWAVPPKELKTFADTGHGTEMLDSDKGPAIQALILEFLSANT